MIRKQLMQFSRSSTTISARQIKSKTKGRETGPEKRVIATSRKTTTSNEVKQRWKNKTYKAYQVNLRKDEDADLIEFVEELRKGDKIGTTDIFRIGIETIKKEGL